MSMKGKTLLKGHTLVNEGRGRRGWSDYAWCSCGVHSHPMTTIAERQRWHREHKEAIRKANEAHDYPHAGRRNPMSDTRCANCLFKLDACVCGTSAAPQPNPPASVWWQEEMDDLKRQLAEARLELAQTQQEWADHECADLKRQLDEARAELNETRAQNCRLRKLSGYDETHPMESRPPSQPTAEQDEAMAAALEIKQYNDDDNWPDDEFALAVAAIIRKHCPQPEPSQPGSVQDTCIHGFLPWMPDQGEPLCSCHLKSKGSVQECHRRTAEALNRAIVGHPTTRDDQIWWASASAAHRYAEIIARECPVPQLSDREYANLSADVFMSIEEALRGFDITRMRGGDNMIQHTVHTAVMKYIDRLTGRKEGE